MADRRSTIEDVAKRAGVSKSTVSRYLNGKPVRSGNYERIREAVGYYHFKANPFARLSAKRSKLIGVVLPDFDANTMPHVLTALDRYLRAKEYRPLFINTGGDLDFEIQSMEDLDRMRVDGIVVVANRLTQAHYGQMERMETPVVFFGQEFEGGYSVVNDDLAAGEDLARWVVDHGYQKAGCLWVPEDDIAVGRRRKEGVLKGLAVGGMKDVPVWETGDSLWDACQRAKAILSGSNPPDALLCATDRIAYGVYKAARELGLRIPQDIGVTGFGGYETSALLDPPLTTVSFDVETAAAICADTILALHDAEARPAPVQVVGFKYLFGGSV